MSERKEACETCRFWHDPESLAAADRPVDHEGWCRRFPPSTEHSLEINGHPSVAAFDWCGEWQPRKTESTEIASSAAKRGSLRDDLCAERNALKARGADMQTRQAAGRAHKTAVRYALEYSDLPRLNNNSSWPFKNFGPATFSWLRTWSALRGIVMDDPFY